MKFKSFLKEMEGVPEQDPNVQNILADVKKIIHTMDDEELDDFGSWLYTSIYDENYNSDDYVEFDLDEVIEMVTSLESEDLKYVYDSLLNAEELDDDDIAYMGAGHTEKDYDDGDYDYDDYDDMDEDEITEKKFFKKKKVMLNREKKQNRVQRRKDKKLRHREYIKHKAVIKRKQAKYRRKVKRNPNIVRRHR